MEDTLDQKEIMLTAFLDIKGAFGNISYVAVQGKFLNTLNDIMNKVVVQREIGSNNKPMISYIEGPAGNIIDRKEGRQKKEK